MRQRPLRVPLSRHLEAILDLLASYNVSSQLNLIEEMIAQGADRQTVLRLLVLASICGGGVKAKSLENLKREVLQVDHLIEGSKLPLTLVFPLGLWIRFAPATFESRQFVPPSFATTATPYSYLEVTIHVSPKAASTST